MKNLVSICLLCAALCFAQASQAQETTKERSTAGKVGHGIKTGTKKAWKGTKKGAKAVGNKTAEVATKGKAKITDKKSKDWEGPEGQTIYVDDGSKYYWVNEKGGRVFVTEAELRPKKKDN